ncbi:hypothetical protein NT6N_34640 [Oceaniferula spumae]|uniref:LysM domain-containing protein n=1 Tax=Oceaniferula spumae TaxID=2979115 RepID=A0AAT9FQZ3_9BACT
MKKTIQTKRTRTSGSNYRVLYAKTGRKRRLHAATATADPHVELESDVANVGIGKALVVILILHVLAIAAIYTHSKFFSDEAVATNKDKAAALLPAAEVKSPEPEPAKPAAVAPVATPAPTPAPEPAAVDHSSRYIVVTGDTYNRIADARNVDESALRALNSNRPLRAGVVLDLPAELSSRPVVVGSTTPKATPAPEVATQIPEPKHARAVEVAEDTAPKAVVVKPKVKHPEAAATGVADSGQRYTVKSGDTVWRIANRYKVSRDTLLKINGMTDPRKLSVGREIKIPTK